MRKLRVLLGVSLAANLLLAPIAENSYLRFAYEQTIAGWLAKVRHPKYVILGDSIAASLRGAGRSDTINLGVSGYTTRQASLFLPRASQLHPEHIIVLVGTNDAGDPKCDLAAIDGFWKQMTNDQRIIVTLSPHTRSVDLNRRVDAINAIVRRSAQTKHLPLIDLADLDDKTGRIALKNTVDGVHLSPRAIAAWRKKLAAIS